MIRILLNLSFLLLVLACNANAKPFRLAGLYAATSYGHFNCTCNQEAACITNAVVKEAKADGLDISYELVRQEHDLYSTVKASNYISSQKFDAAIGTLVSADALVASNIFEKAQIPFIAPVASHPDVTAGKQFSVRVAFNDFRQAKLLARLAARELKARTVVVIKNVSQPYSDFLGTQFRKELEVLDPTIKVSEQVIITGSSDFRSLVQRALESRPDLIFVPLAQASIASIYAELESRDSRLTLLASDTVEGKPQFLAQLGPRAGKIRFIYPQHWNGELQGPEAERYRRLHRKYCGQYVPSMTTVAAYDAAELLVRALQKDRHLRGKTLISAIKALRYHGMTGEIVRGTDGDPIKPLELFEQKERIGGVLDEVRVMPTPSVSTLKRRIRQTSWLPLAVITGTLLMAMAFELKIQFDERLQNTRFALADVMESQKELLGQEVLLNQPQAVEIRLESVLSNWAKKYPGVQACIRASFRTPKRGMTTLERCSLDSRQAGAIFSANKGISTEVGTESERIVSLESVVVQPTRLRDLFPTVLLVTFFLALITAGFAHHILVRQVENGVLNPLLEKISEDQRNAAIAETTRMLAHDVRRPFQALRIALKTMVDSPNSMVRSIGNEICGDVEGSIRAVNAMLQDILDASRELKLQYEDTSLRAMINTVTDSLTRQHPEKTISKIQNISHSKMARADREKVSRVLTNLIENAIQAIGSRGLLEITTQDVRKNGKHFVKVSVFNDGPTIEKADLDSLFIPFFTRRRGGTGLGLWISKKIVDAHGGEIHCHSGPGERTEFWFTIPAATGEDSVKSPPMPEETALSVKTTERNILVFDDENSVHSHWRTYAAKYNYRGICHFLSWEDFVAQDAFALAKDAVAFVDIQFKNSRRDGLDIARALRQLGVRRLYAITSATELARESGLFDEVFGKEVPSNFRALIG